MTTSMKEDDDWEEIPLSPASGDDWEEIDIEEKNPGEPKHGFREVFHNGLNKLSGLKRGADAFKEGAVQAGTFNFANKLREALGDIQAKNASEQLRVEHPIPYFAGEMLGGGPMKTAGYLKQIGEAALRGGLAGLGRSEGNKPWDASIGALGAGGLQAGFGLLGKIPGSQNLQHFANERAIKASTGGQNLAGLRDLLGTTPRGRDVGKIAKNIDQVGKHIFEERAVRPWESAQDIGPRMKALASKFGQKVGETGETLDKIAPKAIDAQKVADKILSFAAELPPTRKYQKIAEQMMAEAEEIAKLGKIDFAEAQKWKNAFKFKATDADSFQSDQKAINAIKRAFTEEMDEAVKAKGGADLFNQYMEAKGKYGSFRPLSNVAGDRKVRELNNRLVSPSDYWSGGIGGSIAGAASGSAGAGLATGMLTGLGNQAARKYGSSAAAVGANRAAQWARAMENTDFAKKYGRYIMSAIKSGPESIVLTDYLLSKDPSYQRWLQFLEREENEQ